VATTGLAVGVVSSMFRSDSAQGLNFAIPIVYVRDLLRLLHEPMTLEQMRLTLGRYTTQTEHGSGPSLKETLSWLEEKLPLWGRTAFTLKTGAAVISMMLQSLPENFESCTVTLAEKATFRTISCPTCATDTTTDRYTVPLGSITDTHIERRNNASSAIETIIGGPEWRYELFLISESKEILAVTTYHTEFNQRSVRIIVDDEPAAKRIQDAFRHAADLCRKKEPF
jgi:hypothetical protein